MISKNRYNSFEVVEALKTEGYLLERAINQLIDDNKGRIDSFILLNNGSKEDAEDVFQEGLTHLILNVRAGKFKADSAVNTYFYAICKGIWYKKFRRAIVERKYKDNQEEESIDLATPELLWINKEQKKLVFELLGGLKGKCREVLMLWARNFSMEDIAEEIGYKNAQIAMNKKSNCLKELKANVGGDLRTKTLMKDLEWKEKNSN